MHILSHSQLLQASGGLNLSFDELENSMKEYSYYSAMVGGILSGTYGLLTTPLADIVTGDAIGSSGRWPSIFLIGIGVSWGVGAGLGAGIAVYNAASVE